MKDGDWRVDKSPSTRNEYRRFWFQKVREDTVRMLADSCVRCGYSDIRALQIDHIQADSELDKKKKGTSYYYNIRKNLDSGRYQVLCANCNVIKRRENQEVKLQGRDGPNPQRIKET